MFLVLLVAAARGDAPGGAAWPDEEQEDCGTCDSLGYLCVAADTNWTDDCGRKLDPAQCPIHSCEAYCKTTLGVAHGKCNDATHVCDCPIAPTPPSCTPLSCLTLSRALVCIPNATLYNCTEHPLAQNACPRELPPCNVQCNTVGGTSKCAANGLQCLCETLPSPPTVPHTRPTARAPAPRARSPTVYAPARAAAPRPVPNTSVTTTDVNTTTTTTTPASRPPAAKAHTESTGGKVSAQVVVAPAVTELTGASASTSTAVLASILSVAGVISLVLIVFAIVSFMRKKGTIKARLPKRSDLKLKGTASRGGGYSNIV